MLDLIVSGDRVVSPHGVEALDVGIADGRIAMLAPRGGLDSAEAARRADEKRALEAEERAREAARQREREAFEREQRELAEAEARRNEEKAAKAKERAATVRRGMYGSFTKK